MTRELKILLIAFLLAAIAVSLIADVGSQVMRKLSADSAEGSGSSSLAIACATPLILGSIILVMILYANFHGNVEYEWRRELERRAEELRDKTYDFNHRR